MIRRFSDSPTIPSRAQQIWQILVGKAMNRQSITYGQLADLIGWNGAGTSGQFLDPIALYCNGEELPPLTVLVVNQDSGVPGPSIPVSEADLHRLRQDVFRYDWFGIVPPPSRS